MSFNENLRTLRLARGLTQPALAEKAAIEQSYLSKLENGRSKPSEDVLARLAQALEVKAEALLQNGDEAAERGRRWRLGLMAAGVLVALTAAFFFGRATAMYPLSVGEVIRGADASENLTRDVMALAPRDVEVIMITRSGRGDRLSIDGRATDAASVQAFMQAIHRSYGGTFPSIHVSPDAGDGAHAFQLEYQIRAGSPTAAD